MTALTREFRETVRARVRGDPSFRAALLSEAVVALVAGDLASGKAILRDFVNATIGFEALSAAVGTPAKSLMRMLSDTGNPTAANLFAVIAHLQAATGVHIEVTATAAE